MVGFQPCGKVTNIGSQYDTIFSYYWHKNSLVQGEIQSVVLDHQDSHSNNKLMKTIWIYTSIIIWRFCPLSTITETRRLPCGMEPAFLW